jgi:site-specific recombinase XerD
MDYRVQLLRDIKINLHDVLSDNVLEQSVDIITCLLKDYEVSQRCTDIVPYQDVNGTLLHTYCACLMIGGKSNKTIEQYKRTAEKLALTVNKTFNEISVFDIRMFLAVEKQRGVSNRTLEYTRANLSAFFQWLTKEEHISKNPCANIDPIKYNDKERFPFSVVEIDALRFACNTLKERAIVEMLLATGLRVSELSDLKLSDIDLNNLAVHVRHGKGDKARTVYMNDLARQHLLDYLTNRNVNTEYVFINKKKNKLNAGGIRYILKMIGKRANVSNVHPHRFRRTFATNLVNRGMDVQEVQKLMGHTNINTTMEYICVTDEKVHASYKQFTI